MASEKPKNNLPDRRKTIALLKSGRRPALRPGSPSDLAWKGLEKLYKEGDLQDLMAQIEREIEPAPRRIISPAGWLTGLAATLALALATWWMWPERPVQSERWILDLPVAVPMAGADRGESVHSIKQQAVEAYQTKQYGEAIRLFDTYLNQVPTDQLVRLYYGISLLETRKYQPGLDVLRDVQQFMIAPELRPASDWYLSLAWYYNGQPMQAADMLRDILRQPDHPYRSNALAMLAWM